MTDDPELSAIRGTAFVDGRYVPLAEASVPILDRGFVRSDATYDVAHVWKGRFFRLDDHVARFQASMAGLRMVLPYTSREIADIMIECVRRSGLRDAYVQVTCTRGLPPAGTRDPRLCRNRLCLNHRRRKFPHHRCRCNRHRSRSHHNHRPRSQQRR